MNISFLNFLHVYTIPHPPPQKCRPLFVARNRRASPELHRNSAFVLL
jgi:hypothetical protein